MAHKASQGATKLGRDSQAKRLGLKRGNNQVVKAGQIILRQRGSKYFLGKNVAFGKDFTIFAKKEGKIRFYQKKKKNFYGKSKLKTFVEVVPLK